MPRRSVLSAAERQGLVAVPSGEENLHRLYGLSERDVGLIHERRGTANRLGFAVLLAYMRYPGIVLGVDETPAAHVVAFLADQLGVPAEAWGGYDRGAATSRRHVLELQRVFGFVTFTAADHEPAVESLAASAMANDHGAVLAEELVVSLRRRKVLLPALPVVEKICSEAITRANRAVYAALTEGLDAGHRRRLDGLLQIAPERDVSMLVWLRQSPARPNSKQMREHLDRLRGWKDLGLPDGVRFRVHQNRLLRLAKEGAHMTASDLGKFEPFRRYATLVAVAVESMATVIDEVINLHDQIFTKVFSSARNRHKEQFHQSGREINDKVRFLGRVGQLLLDARENGTDPFEDIDTVLGWEAFTAEVIAAQALARPKEFDFLAGIANSSTMVRRYWPGFLDELVFRAAPAAADLMAGVDVLRRLSSGGSRTIQDGAPEGFVSRRWVPLVFTEAGIDPVFYELCILSRLKDALRSGDVWVEGSRQFKDFEDYLIPPQVFRAGEGARFTLPAAADPATYLADRVDLLNEQLAIVDRLAAAGELPEASISTLGLKTAPLETIVPEEAKDLVTQLSGMLPRARITDMLLELDAITGFTDDFPHLKTGAPPKDKTLLLTAILADGINLGLVKMSEACTGATYSKMLRTQAMHIRDETYAAALARLVNAQAAHPFAHHWGDGSTSSSDGQRFRTSSKAEATGHINPKYGASPGRMIYTHISDQYSPYHAKLVNVGVRDATYVIDGLLHHESELKVTEHYTDTAGFTDHVFALTTLLGYRFAPRIRGIDTTRIYTPDKTSYEALEPIVGGTIDTSMIAVHWPEILRLAASIKHGTVTASLMLRKLGSYPRQNGLAKALREYGRMERTLFILDWAQDPDLRQRVTAGLNKGEARNALARAVFFNRLGEIRDRSFEQQNYRASGLTLLTAAIVHWNTIYTHHAVTTLTQAGNPPDPNLLKNLSPLGWEHLNLTGDYTWRHTTKPGKLRPLRSTPR
ncbi:Tn3 family transposase (plasmid) [Pseudarthrobacter psychrotolerans]|uniref:Tn3 family transposase n=1 Tax=Pseudarthrobacter psychrotolerans TaxID=2697569 RepID=A0A6P1NPK7_9MICC|nr:Tn3 family transposase [Pseudarthrobacter psychrotolerans]QHK22625.1 Tn3 family transposase [Pseudarthrobacter psychrotolerans]